MDIHPLSFVIAAIGFWLSGFFIGMAVGRRQMLKMVKDITQARTRVEPDQPWERK